MKGISKVFKALLVRGLILLLVFTFIGTAAAVASGNLVVNGSFEEPQIAAFTWNVFGSIPGWTGTGCGIEIQNRVAGSPLAGNQHVELDSHCSSSMYQDIPTQPGSVYTLKFGYSPRPGVDDNRIKVRWDGMEVADLNVSGIGLGDTSWTYHTLTVVTMGSTTRLEFIDASFSNGYGGYIDDVSVELSTVQIDIKPGSFPNSINPKSKGKIPVAILTTNSFDATTVDPTTVLFGATGTEAAPVQAALEDVDGDEDTDMILHFNTQDTGIACGDTSASLTGETLGGEAIQGSDSINTVGCK